jgi:hypothetical protein
MRESAKRLQQQAVVVEKSALPAPVLTYDTGARLWRLERAYVYADETGPRTITVPAGFRFDLSSVPRLLWWLIAPFDLSIVAPLMHDFLYKHRGQPPAGAILPPHRYSRADTDRLFRQIMEQENVSAWRRAAAYAAVRSFGRWAWRRDAMVPLAA